MSSGQGGRKSSAELTRGKKVDIRTDHGGRYYVQITENQSTGFEQALDRQIEDHDTWNLSMPGLGCLDVNDPYESVTAERSRLSLEISMKRHLRRRSSCRHRTLERRALEHTCSRSPGITHERTAPPEPPEAW